ncbi:MAG: hybrid sensor histidine kinase/response regulator [Leptospiraceae bacterium]|nr:hybrid sensor histidine kinase/response regulator [Leptospiraceae bacterium]
MQNKPLVLIVDDTEYNIILLKQILLNEGYRVLSAMSGKDCLKILETEIPDIILLDVIMPEMNGFDIADRIKSNEKINSIPIIFLSAVSDYETKLKGLGKGAVDYITKPYDDREVIARIQLQLRIKELEKERLEHIKKLEFLDREKDNLLQIIAHDMRSPLTSIMLMAEFLMIQENEIDKEKLSKYSNTIFNSSKKILKLINQLMKSTKVESAKIDITQFDLVKSISHSTDLVTRLLEKKNIHLDINTFASEIFVKLDESKLDQILNNIIYNAIKFTNQNGFIKIAVDRDSNTSSLHIAIEDNGIGMPNNIKETVFSKKLVNHREGTNGEDGTGLGLSITKNLVTLLEGDIRIESEENKGTTIHLYFYNC